MKITLFKQKHNKKSTLYLRNNNINNNTFINYWYYCYCCYPDWRTWCRLAMIIIAIILCHFYLKLFYFHIQDTLKADITQLGRAINTTVLTTARVTNNINDLVHNLTGPLLTRFLDNVS